MIRRILAQIERHSGALLAVYLVVLLVATHYPQDVLRGGGALEIDKLIHLAAYGVLGALVAMRLPRWPAGTVVLTATLISTAIGLADELTQPWFNRVCDPLDLLADAVGAALGAAAWLRLAPSASLTGSNEPGA